MKYELYNSFADLKLLDTVFLNRGFNIGDIEHYLNTTDEDLYPLNLLDNLEQGALLLLEHIYNNKKIFIQCDSDADGFTSSAFLINYLYSIFPDYCKTNLGYRLHEGKQHGVILETIPEEADLIIIPDAGSNQFEEHQILSEQGKTILILDHHEAPYVSPHACVINNQLCNYPNKTLSGVGIVYKFCCQLDEILDLNKAEEFIDLAALGIIADVMDLRNFETKHILAKGFKNIKNPFIAQTIKDNEFLIKGVISARSFAFYIAPLINATIRLGTQEEKQILFWSMLEHMAYEKVPSTKRGHKGEEETILEQACRSCKNIKNRQSTACERSLQEIEKLIEKNNLLENKILAVKIPKDTNIPKEIVGLMANQLMSKYERPVLLLRENENQDWEGSARGNEQTALNNLKGFLSSSNLFNYCEGHKAAFGVSINETKFQEFIEYTNTKLKDITFDPCYKVDKIYQEDDVKNDDILDIAHLKPIWGQGIEEPLIAIENIKVTMGNITLMSPDKHPTLKILLPNGIELIKFRSSLEEFESLCNSASGCTRINIIGKCEKNEWNYKINPQIIIEDYEITNVIPYYF